MIHSIKEIINVEPFKLILKFNNKEIRLVDLTEKLNEWGAILNRNLQI